MKKLSIVILMGIICYGCGSSKALITADKSPVAVTIDLVNVTDDKVIVTVDPGAFTTDIISFFIPKTVPGTYSTDNYGKYIEGFKALDYDGKELAVTKADDNTWTISNGKKLDKVTYLVNDTFDSEGEQEEAVFSPAGTNILAGENFVLNLHGFVGYFNRLKEVPYNLNVTVPEGLVATTSLTKVSGPNSTSSLDIYSASRYFEVIDNPIFYSKPNTETFQINDISVTLSVYSPTGVYTAASLKNRMEEMMAQTGERGFHFVDEAAPPALMRGLALEILRRGMKVSWWTNIRFEKSFTADLCILLSASGCIAVSGGLEVASNRLLELIQKGVTVEQVAQVSRNLTESGIMVHAYLMYAYPTQTVQETIDSLEMVRQMFELQILRSGFWHQFAMTAHSPVGMEPEKYGVEPIKSEITFADNDVQFIDRTGIDHNVFSYGLKKSLYNYMHDRCFEMPLQEWFDFEIPETSVSSDFIVQALADKSELYNVSLHSKLVWIGKISITDQNDDTSLIQLHDKIMSKELVLDTLRAQWLSDKLNTMTPQSERITSYGDFRKDYETQFHDFTLFWFEEAMERLREFGLLVL